MRTAGDVYDNYIKNKQSTLAEIRQELLRLPDKSYAVRSSTTSEDSEQFTYAGQFKTLTNIIGADNLVKAIQEIWDSAICCHETEYHKRTLKGRTGCAVIIQEMISSKLAGVSFSRNPLTNQQEIIIEAVEGPGEDLAQKGLTPLRWKFRKNSLSEGDRDYKYISLISKIASDTLKLGRALIANERFAQMWRIGTEMLASRDEHAMRAFVLDQLEDPAGFEQKLR